MTQYGTAGMAAPAPQLAPPPLPCRLRTEAPTASFAGIAALGAAFAGFVSYGRDPDVLTTALAAGLTFLGALVGLHVLYLAFRLAMALAKIAIPVALILAVGCALDWPWAQATVDWLWAAGSSGAEAAEQGWTAWRMR